MVTVTPRSCRWLHWTLALAALLLSVGLSAQQEVTERQVQAAFLLRFLADVTWPDTVLPESGGTVVIGVMGDTAMFRELRAMAADLRPAGRGLEIRRLDPGAPLAGVHMVYIGRVATGRVVQALDDAAKASVLAVSSMDAPLPASMINFVVQNDRVGFDVWIDNIRDAGLALSAPVLEVARRVVGDP